MWNPYLNTLGFLEATPAEKKFHPATGLTAFLHISKCTVSLGGAAADLPRVSPMGSMAVVTAGGFQKLPRGRKQISR